MGRRRYEDLGCIVGWFTVQKSCQVEPQMHFAPKLFALHLKTLGNIKPICFSFIYTLYIKMLVLVKFLSFHFKKSA